MRVSTVLAYAYLFLPVELLSVEEGVGAVVVLEGLEDSGVTLTVDEGCMQG